MTIIYRSLWSRNVPFSLSTKVRRRPCQVEIIVDIFEHFVRDLNRRVFSIEPSLELLFIKWIWHIVGLLNWISVIIFEVFLFGVVLLLQLFLLCIVSSFLSVHFIVTLGATIFLSLDGALTLVGKDCMGVLSSNHIFSSDIESHLHPSEDLSKTD